MKDIDDEFDRFPISIAVIVLIFIHHKHRKRIFSEDLENDEEGTTSDSSRFSGFKGFFSIFSCSKKYSSKKNPKRHHLEESSLNCTIPDIYLPPVLLPSQEDLNLFSRTFYNESNETRYHTGISNSTHSLFS
ncbi:hypothetical protein PCK2_001028 [Pneumocystis canis]|nr:hypothetical protein PCK2_001028 [Pneumocystis canis]